MPNAKSIHIELYFTALHLDDRFYKDKNIVLIDVLRSSTTISMALQNGAKEIIPVKNIETALKISGGLAGDVTLRGGERQGKMIEGFDLGNSPIEYTRARVNAKSIILFTTNGSPAIVSGRFTRNLLIAGFVNIGAVVNVLRELKSDFIIICAGQDGKFCLEDSVCGGRLINEFTKDKEIAITLNDSAAAAVALDKSFGKNIHKMLELCDHGKYLASIGYADDLKICGSLNSIPVVPSLSNGTLRLAKPETNQASHRSA
ncbi:MAG: 2-phosphosulfolactate phosphatase [Bacteroidota bacterium]